MSVQSRIRPVLVFSFFILILFSLSGCFSGASPGMKVLNITAEQYFNDSIRYLDQPQFLYDQSKINTALGNLEKNSGSGSSDSKEKIDLMVNYLKILKQYSAILKNARRPDRKELDRIFKNIHDYHTDNYLFLRLFYYYVRSYDRKPMTRVELLNVYALCTYLTQKEFTFVFRFGGESIDRELISYFKDSIFLQHKYFKFVEEDLNISLDDNKLDPDVLLRAGEFYFRASVYDESLKSLKYFRLPTFSGYGLKDHCLNLLEKIYEKEKMDTDKKVVSEKIENRFASKFDIMFPYISPEEKVLYRNILNKPEINIIEDMLDINNDKNLYLVKDFYSFQQKELREAYRILKNDNKFIDTEENVRDFYNVLYDNESFVNRKSLLYFYNENIVILPIEKKDGYFIKADNISLKKNKDNIFAYKNVRKDKDDKIEFLIEFSSEKGIEEEKIILNSGDFE